MLLLMVSAVFIHANFTVSYAGGKNFLLRDGSKIRLRTSDKLKASDTIISGAKSFVAIRSDDGSIYKIAANTTTRLDSYFNGKTQRKATFTLGRGKVFSFISKTFKKSDVKFLTSSGVVGVRGTSFLLDNTDDSLKVYSTEGSVAIYETEEAPTPITVVNSGEIAEKNEGEAMVKITPLTQDELKQATVGIPSTMEEIKEAFGGGGGSSREEDLISEEIRALKAIASESIQEIDAVVERNVEEIEEREQVRLKTIDGYSVVQHYSRAGNTVNIGSTSSKDGLMNTFSLSFTRRDDSYYSYNDDFSFYSLRRSVFSIMGHDTRDGATWGMTMTSDYDHYNSEYHTRDYTINSLLGSGGNKEIIRINHLDIFNESLISPRYSNKGIFPNTLSFRHGGSSHSIFVDYEVDLGNRVLNNSSDHGELFNHLYPFTEFVPQNRNVKVTLSSTAGLFGGRTAEAYYFTDGFRDYVNSSSRYYDPTRLISPITE